MEIVCAGFFVSCVRRIASARLCAVTALFVLGSSIGMAAPLHTEGFEAGQGDWQSYQSTLSRVSSGSTGFPSASGGYHLELTDPASPPSGYYSGAYSFLGGSRTDFGTGWSSSLDVYIDLNDPGVGGGTYGFDLSQAMYDSGGSHEQDNIFHVGAADPAGDGSYEVYVNASHNSEFKVTPNKLTSPSQPYGSSEAAGLFADSGWYSFGFDFAPSQAKPGFVEVGFSVEDQADNPFWSANWTTEAYPLSEAGGNGYMWITFSEAERLAIDNAQLSSHGTAVMPEPATVALPGIALVGLAGIRPRRRFAA
jgi:hypothetical protein